jgi:hypothetical protein
VAAGWWMLVANGWLLLVDGCMPCCVCGDLWVLCVAAGRWVCIVECGGNACVLHDRKQARPPVYPKISHKLGVCLVFWCDVVQCCAVLFGLVSLAEKTDTSVKLGGAAGANNMCDVTAAVYVCVWWLMWMLGVLCFVSVFGAWCVEFGGWFLVFGGWWLVGSCWMVASGWWVVVGVWWQLGWLENDGW